MKQSKLDRHVVGLQILSPLSITVSLNQGYTPVQPFQMALPTGDYLSDQLPSPIEDFSSSKHQAGIEVVSI